MFILVFQIFDSVGYPNSCIFSSKLVCRAQQTVHSSVKAPRRCQRSYFIVTAYL